MRGGQIAMVFQDPMTFLNPVYTAGEQVAEAIRTHQGKNRAEAKSARSSSSAPLASRMPKNASRLIRTSFPADCGSA